MAGSTEPVTKLNQLLEVVAIEL